MSAVNSASSTAASTASATASATTSLLGAGDFMKLLLAQLQNQDPLSPSDSTAFVAELAQFSQVELQQGISTQLGQLVVGTAAGNEVESASLAGKSVQYNTSNVQLTSTPPVSLQANLAGPAQSVVWSVADSTGKVVRTLQSANAPAGTVNVSWDGKDASGNALTPGAYTLTAVASNGASSVGVTMQGTGTVSSITYQNGYPQLVINGQNINMSSLVQVFAPSN